MRRQLLDSTESNTTSQLGTILVLFLVLRLSILFFYSPQGLRFPESDIGFYYDTAALSERGFYPFVNMWYEYPPLLAYFVEILYIAARWAAASIGLAQEPVFARLLSLSLLLFDTGTLVLLHHTGKKIWGLAQANSMGWVYSTLSMPLMMLQFSHQAVAVFLTMLAVTLFVDGRPRLSALALGLAIAAKLLPLFLLAPALRWLWPDKRRVAEYLGITLASATLVYAPFLLLGGGPWIAASFRALADGRSYATLWAMLDKNWGPGYYGPLETRLSLEAAATVDGRPPVVPALALLRVFAVLYALFFFRRVTYTRPESPERARGFVWFSTLTLAVFFLWLKGWSPQYALLMIPLVLLSFPDGRGLAAVLLLSALSTTHWTENRLMMSVLILARATFFIGILRLAGLALWPRPEFARMRAQPVPVTGLLSKKEDEE